jgi:F1F0 ATPase subunit 2
MNESLSLVLALSAGLALGALFFGGLWWTVRRGIASQRPALWFLASLLTRMGVVLTGFYYTGREDWQRWLVCLVGFILARSIVKRSSKSRRLSYAS